jgi:hypothetical protein
MLATESLGTSPCRNAKIDVVSWSGDGQSDILTYQPARPPAEVLVRKGGSI